MNTTNITLAETASRLILPWPQEIFIVEGGVIIIFNFLVIILITSRSRLRKRLSNIFLVNLLLSHIVEGCMAIYIAGTFNENHKKQDSQSSHMRIAVFSADTLLSCLNNIPVTGDRLIAIKWPYIYRKLNTLKAGGICAISWLVTIVYFVVILNFKILTPNAGDIFSSVLITITVTILLTANTLIYKVVRRHTNAIKTNYVEPGLAVITSVNEEMSTRDTSYGECSDGSPSVALKQKRNYNLADTRQRANTNSQTRAEERCIRSAYICAGIVLSYIISFMPHMVHDIIKLLNLQSGVYTGNLSAKITIFIAFCNSIVDPIIYTSLNKEFKKEWKMCFRM